MKKRGIQIKLASIFAILLILLSSQTAFSQTEEPFSINNSPLPAPTGFVNDYAGVIDEATKQALEQKIKAFNEKTNPPVELAVAVVRTTGEREIFDYSLAVARGWGIGSKNDDNPSALLFIAIDDRKYFTQVSRDLEDELPDGLVGQLQRQYLVPEFKNGNYAKGISDTIDAYIRTIEQRQSGEPVAAAENKQRESRGSLSLCNTFVCLIILFVLMMIIFGRSGKSRRGRGDDDDDRWGGGGGGSALPWIIGSIIANSGSSSGSSWGGSSDWGGDSGGWGGFGGGGDFGGGGAGGDW